LIDATLRQKSYFQKLVWSHALKGLYNVDVPNFVGLGAVRYIPPLLTPVATDPQTIPLAPRLGLKLQQEIDSLNEMLAAKLISTNEKSIYQKAIDNSGNSCIVLGVDTTPMVQERCQEYLNEIIQTASIVVEEFDFSKQVGKILESGIKEAQERIRRENERIEAELGIIRKIPIFGSVWNWWMPSNQTLPGNSYNLLTTVVSDPSIKKIKKPSFESSSTPILPTQESSPTQVSIPTQASSTQTSTPTQVSTPIQASSTQTPTPESLPLFTFPSNISTQQVTSPSTRIVVPVVPTPNVPTDSITQSTTGSSVDTNSHGSSGNKSNHINEEGEKK